MSTYRIVSFPAGTILHEHEGRIEDIMMRAFVLMMEEETEVRVEHTSSYDGRVVDVVHFVPGLGRL